MDLLTTDDAAGRLGVSGRRVRALIEQGDLDAEQIGRMYLVQAESVARLGQRRATGRSLSNRMSWAVLLSDFGTTGFDEIARTAGLSRTDRQRAIALRDRQVEDWSWLARRRAVATRHTVRDGYLDRLLSDDRCIRSGLSALKEHRVDLVGRRGDAELYVAEHEVEGLLSDYLLHAGSAGRVTVHAVGADVLRRARLAGRSVMTATTVGVDLAEHADTRTRRAGYELLQRVARG
jgi:excisionase family DNA binding protein